MILCNNCFTKYDEELGLCPNCGYVEGEKASDAFCLLPGTILNNRYIVGMKINSGGFGIVYKAWDRKLESIVAIKEYFPSGLANRQPGEKEVIVAAAKRVKEYIVGRERFLEEAVKMAKFMNHKNIVNVYENFSENNTAYFVMGFLDGNTLSEEIQKNKGPLPYEKCINIAVEVCDALKAVHKEKYLHRDISPDNIMLCKDGSVRLFDFGAARFSAETEKKLTVVIKPGFAPPEQYEKVNRQDPRTDIYALGATLYYAMTREKPEESTNRKIKDGLREPSLLNPSIPKNISSVIMKAMEIEQQYRFSNVDEFKEALLSEKEYLYGEKEKKRRRRKRIIGISASFLLIIIAAVFFVIKYKSEEAKVGLPDAEVEVFYLETGVDELDKSKYNALNKIIGTFTTEYDNVQVKIKSVDYDNYESFIRDTAGKNNKLQVYEIDSSNVIKNNNSVDLRSIFGSLVDKSYYNDKLCSKTTYPTDIIVPIIYINKSKGIEIDEITKLDKLIEICKLNKEYFVVKDSSVDMYCTLYGPEIVDYYVENAIDEFVNRNALVYFGDSTDYFRIQREMPGQYTLIVPNTGYSVYKVGTTWSASAYNEQDIKVVTSLVSYLTSDLAQDYLNIQNQNGRLPIIKDSLKKYLGVYDEFADVENFLSLPYVVPEENISELLKNADTSNLEALKSISVPEFTDVSEEAWYADAVSYVCSKGIMLGNSETTFNPDGKVSKLSTIVILYRLAGSPTVTDGHPFSDVTPNTEAWDAVSWAFNNQIITAANDGKFNGAKVINLETAMLLFSRYEKVLNSDSFAEADLSRYSDGDEVSPWAVEGIKWALSNKVISTKLGEKIRPKSEITRARISVIIMRMLENKDN